MRIMYNSNNSAGGWWLKDEDWYALEKAGWKVEWVHDWKDKALVKDGRFLGALAERASKTGLSYSDAVTEFEKITGHSAEEVGCECCDPPHYFDEVDDE